MKMKPITRPSCAARSRQVAADRSAGRPGRSRSAPPARPPAPAPASAAVRRGCQVPAAAKATSSSSGDEQHAAEQDRERRDEDRVQQRRDHASASAIATRGTRPGQCADELGCRAGRRTGAGALAEVMRRTIAAPLGRVEPDRRRLRRTTGSGRERSAAGSQRRDPASQRTRPRDAGEPGRRHRLLRQRAGALQRAETPAPAYRRCPADGPACRRRSALAERCLDPREQRLRLVRRRGCARRRGSRRPGGAAAPASRLTCSRCSSRRAARCRRCRRARSRSRAATGGRTARQSWNASAPAGAFSWLSSDARGDRVAHQLAERARAAAPSTRCGEREVGRDEPFAAANTASLRSSKSGASDAAAPARRQAVGGEQAAAR